MDVARNGPNIEFKVRKPDVNKSIVARPVALVLALSATIVDDEEFTRVLGDDTAIWSISAESPHNDIMKRASDLAEFRRIVRSLFNEIKARHGETTTINVFPALPVSAAIEFGRVWMPKADLPIVVYDQNRRVDGFVQALEISARSPHDFLQRNRQTPPHIRLENRLADPGGVTLRALPRSSDGGMLWMNSGLNAGISRFSGNLNPPPVHRHVRFL